MHTQFIRTIFIISKSAKSNVPYTSMYIVLLDAGARIAKSTETIKKNDPGCSPRIVGVVPGDDGTPHILVLNEQIKNIIKHTAK